MLGRAIIVLLALTAFCHAAGPTRSPEKLRSLAQLPTVNIRMGLVIDHDGQPQVLLRSTNSLPKEIAALRTQMTGDASDAERYFLISRHLWRLQQPDESLRALSKAVESFRIRAEARPKDGPLQAAYASALQSRSNLVEAEKVLQNAVREAPDDWTCWVELGQLLASQVQKSAFHLGAEIATNALAGKTISPAEIRSEIESLTNRWAEAGKCFDRAVAAAPKNSTPYMQRAVYRSAAELMAGLGKLFQDRAMRDEKRKLETLAESVSAPEICADWATAARLSPTNSAIIAFWGFVEGMFAIKESGGLPLSALPENRRKNVLEAIRMLENLTESSDPVAAASAWEFLGVIRFTATREPSQMKTAFRRTVELDPSRAQAWEGLMAAAMILGDATELLSVCEERLKHEDTIRNRVFAVKACDRAKQDGKALEHARAAVKLDGESLLARICLHALLIRRSTSPRLEPELIEQHKKILALVTALPKKAHDSDFVELASTALLNSSIVGILNGEPTEARKQLNKLAQSKGADDKVKEGAREVLVILGN